MSTSIGLAYRKWAPISSVIWSKVISHFSFLLLKKIYTSSLQTRSWGGGKERWKGVLNKEAEPHSHPLFLPTPHRIHTNKIFLYLSPWLHQHGEINCQPNPKRIKEKYLFRRRGQMGEMESSIKGWRDWPRECGIQEGVYFQNKSLLITYFSTDEKNGMSRACAWAWGHAHSGLSYWVSKSSFCSVCSGGRQRLCEQGSPASYP